MCSRRRNLDVKALCRGIASTRKSNDWPERQSLSARKTAQPRGFAEQRKKQSELGTRNSELGTSPLSIANSSSPPLAARSSKFFQQSSARRTGDSASVKWRLATCDR